MPRLIGLTVVSLLCLAFAIAATAAQVTTPSPVSYANCPNTILTTMPASQVPGGWQTGGNIPVAIHSSKIGTAAFNRPTLECRYGNDDTLVLSAYAPVGQTCVVIRTGQFQCTPQNMKATRIPH
jgi:hypothetical protein